MPAKKQDTPLVEKPEPPSFVVAALQRKRKRLDRKIFQLRREIAETEGLTNELNRRLDERGEIDAALRLVLKAEGR